MKQRIAKLQLKALAVLAHRQTFVAVVGLLILASVVIARLTVLSSYEPTEDLIDEKTQTTQLITFNKDAIEAMERLKSSNARAPGTQFQKDRNNPFSE